MFEKIVVWVRKFKAVGDIAVQYDPAHASLPWAGVRLILQVGRRLHISIKLKKFLEFANFTADVGFF